MRYFILATDYDGTLARHGKVDDSTLAALQKLRDSGRIPILVTGRQVDDLLSVFPDVGIFERIVAENGAVIFNPANRKERVLGAPPPDALIRRLREVGVPVAVGRVIVATVTPHETAVLEAVRELGLGQQVIFNKGAVMVLPAGMNKASGLKAALAELGFSPHAMIGIGDAENDRAFLDLCECSAAVANALPAVKDHADLVVNGSHGAGVSELIERLVATDLVELEARLERHNIPLGFRSNGEIVNIKPYGCSVLVTGTSGGGKSTLTTGFMERLEEKKYQFCIVDPEGDYSETDAVLLGDSNRAPSASEVVDVLMHPDQNVIVNLTGVKPEDRPLFFETLLPQIQAFRAKTGRPHWFFVNEIHHLLPESCGPSPLIHQPMHGIWLVTVHPEHVSRSVLLLVDTVVAIGAFPGQTIRSFSKELEESPLNVPEVDVAAEEAIVWKRGSGEQPFRIRSIPVKTEQRCTAPE